MQQEPTVGAIVSRRQIISPQGNKIFSNHGIKKGPITLNQHEILEKTIKFGSNILGEPTAILFRREILKQALPFDSTSSYVLDMTGYFNIQKETKFYFSNTTDVAFRINQSSISLINRSTQADEFIRFIMKEVNRAYIDISSRRIYKMKFKAHFLQVMRKVIYVYSKILDCLVKPN
jgi:hypothetical protein